MGRRTIEVDRTILQTTINEIEFSGPARTQSELWQKVCSKYNSKVVPEPITPAVVSSRFYQWKLTCQTPKGKRGRQSLSEEQKAAMQQARGERTPRAEKFQSDKKIRDALSSLRSNTEERFQPVVDKIVGGSMSAAVKLKCLDCCCGQTQEVAQCQVYACPLWAFRPYKKVKNENADSSSS